MPLFDEQQKNVIAAVLPKYMTQERFFGVCELAYRNPALRDCTPASLVRCFIQAAELGLEPNTPLGHAYIIPFKNTKLNRTFATLVVGWRGMITNAVRCGAATKVVANAVRAGELFKYRPVDPMAPIIHEPDLNADDADTDNIIGAYAVAFLRDGIQAEYMSRTQIDRIRSRSKAKDDGPWVTDFAEMARKCPTRRLFKYLAVTGDTETASRFTKTLELDDKFMGDLPEDEDEPPAIMAQEPAKQAEPEKKRGRPPKQQEPPTVDAASTPPSTPEPPKPAEAPPPPIQQTLTSAPEPAPVPQPPEDRAISAAEYTELEALAKKLHPNRTMSWLNEVLQESCKVSDLADVKLSQLPILMATMEKKK